MIAGDKRVRVLLGDGTIEAEVARRLADTLATAGDRTEWTPTTEARVRMAVAVALHAIHRELSARPGLPWDESMALDVLLGQPWVNRVMAHLDRNRPITEHGVRS